MVQISATEFKRQTLLSVEIRRRPPQRPPGAKENKNTKFIIPNKPYFHNTYSNNKTKKFPGKGREDFVASYKLKKWQIANSTIFLWMPREWDRKEGGKGPEKVFSSFY